MSHPHRIIIRLRRHIALVRAWWLKFTLQQERRRGLYGTVAFLSMMNQRVPHNPRSAFWGALTCIAAAASLACWAWFAGGRLGPLQLEVPWRYALVSVGLTLLALLLALCGVFALRWRGGCGTSCRIAGAVDYVMSLGCVIVLASFRALDVWNTAFDEYSWRYPVYSALRVIFMAYLAAALAGSGKWVLALIESRWGEISLGSIERALVAFFLGAAAWYIVFFAAGIAGALRYFIVAPLFVLGVWSSRALLHNACQRTLGWVLRGLRTATLVRLTLICLPLGVLSVSWLHVLVNRGLAVVGFDYDSSGHYLPYYQAVVEQGGTSVNELWYHFWISKGAALHFVATMLTDLEGPQLVSFTFLTAAVLALALLVRYISGYAAVGISAGAILLAPFSLFSYYQKQHIVTAAFVSGMLWVVTRSWLSKDYSKASSIGVLSVLAVAAVLNAPPFAAVACLFLGLTALTWGIASKAAGGVLAWATTIPAATAFAAVVVVLLINYALTGLLEVTPFRLFWSLVDQSVFSTLVSPYLMLFLDAGTAPATGNASLLDPNDSMRIVHLLHVQFLPDDLALTATSLLAGAFIVGLFDKKLRSLFFGAIVPAAAFVASAAALAIVIRQPGSMDRFYVFSLVPVAYLAITGPAIIVRRLNDRQSSTPALHSVRIVAVPILLAMGVLDT